MYSPRLVDTLNGIAQRYAGLIEGSVRDVISQPRYRATGKGLASLKVEVVPGNEQTAPKILIAFDEGLAALGRRKMQWTKLPDISKLMEWALTKKSDEKEARQLAWATAWDKKKNDTWKPKLWRKRSLSAVLKEMNDLILAEYDKAIEADLVQSTKV